MTTTTDALDALRLALTTDSRDWGQTRGDAWIYGILVGWDCEEDHDHEYEYCEGGAFDLIADQHGWNAATRSQLRGLRRAVREHQEGSKTA